jgi:hypothetical protein
MRIGEVSYWDYDTRNLVLDAPPMCSLCRQDSPADGEVLCASCLEPPELGRRDRETWEDSQISLGGMVILDETRRWAETIYLRPTAWGGWVRDFEVPTVSPVRAIGVLHQKRSCP